MGQIKQAKKCKVLIFLHPHTHHQSSSVSQPQADKNDDKGSSKATTCKAQLVEEELRAGKLPAQPAIVVVVVVVVVV